MSTESLGCCVKNGPQVAGRPARSLICPREEVLRTWTRRAAEQRVGYCVLFQVTDSGPILKMESVGFAGELDMEYRGGGVKGESRSTWKDREATC